MKKLNDYEKRYLEMKKRMLAAISEVKCEHAERVAEADAELARLNAKRTIACIQHRQLKRITMMTYHSEERSEQLRKLREELDAKLASINAAIENAHTVKRLADEGKDAVISATKEAYKEEHERIRAEEEAWRKSRWTAGLTTYSDAVEAVRTIRKFCRQDGKEGITINLGEVAAVINFEQSKQENNDNIIEQQEHGDSN